MSWEGYKQVICPNGHPYTDFADGYNTPEDICPDCQISGGEENIVDQTNGCMNWCPIHKSWKQCCENFQCQCGMRELVLVTPAITERCSLGFDHVRIPATFKFGKTHVFE